MHIEPGVVDGAKMAFAYGSAAAAAGYSLKLAADEIKNRNIASFGVRTGLATLAVLTFFEILPHFPVGVSEVHFILGTTILLVLGAAPAAFGLAAGLAIQGMLFAPTDLPMYFVNLTTLLVPLFAVHALAKRIVPAGKAYVDLDYTEVLKLSGVYQGGIVAWVAFWAFYGQGFGAENFGAVMSFGAAYLIVIAIEPLADLAVLATAKALRGRGPDMAVSRRLYNAA